MTGLLDLPSKAAGNDAVLTQNGHTLVELLIGVGLQVKQQQNDIGLADQVK